MLKGAHAVIIVDKVEQNLEPVVVSDDGTGDDVQIPSLLIPHGVGMRLIEATRQAEVIVELNWGAPISNVVNVDLWMSSASPLTGQFLHDFATVRRLLAGDMQFQPHYHVFSLNASYENRDLHCIEDGKLCAEDPDGSGPITGVTVLQEDMRQLCIHDLSRETNMERGGLAFSSDYWNYVERFMEECPLQGQEPRMFGEECSLALMSSLHLDSERVQSCVRDSQVSRLTEELDHVAWSPIAMQINGWRYTGMLRSGLVARAICTGFTTPPQQCATLSSESTFQAPAGTKRSSQSLVNAVDVDTKHRVIDAQSAGTLADALEDLLREDLEETHTHEPRAHSDVLRDDNLFESRRLSITAASVLSISAFGGFAVGMCYHARANSARMKERLLADHYTFFYHSRAWTP